LFGCGGLLKLKLVECIWNHIHPTDHITAFNVTKRVAWALRGEGAGLLIKTGGENIAAWQGNLFSASRIVEFGTVTAQILERLESPAAAPVPAAARYLRRQAEVSQDSLHHRRLFKQRHEASRPPHRGHARTSNPNVRRISSAH
jgi:hypothetical protein